MKWTPTSLAISALLCAGLIGVPLSGALSSGEAPLEVERPSGLVREHESVLQGSLGVELQVAPHNGPSLETILPNSPGDSPGDPVPQIRGSVSGGSGVDAPATAAGPAQGPNRGPRPTQQGGGSRGAVSASDSRPPEPAHAAPGARLEQLEQTVTFLLRRNRQEREIAEMARELGLRSPEAHEGLRHLMLFGDDLFEPVE